MRNTIFLAGVMLFLEIGTMGLRAEEPAGNASPNQDATPSGTVILDDGSVLLNLSGMTLDQAKSVWGQVRNALSFPPALAQGKYKEIPRPSDAEINILNQKPGFIVSKDGADDRYDVRLKTNTLAVYRELNPNPHWQRTFEIPLTAPAQT